MHVCLHMYGYMNVLVLEKELFCLMPSTATHCNVLQCAILAYVVDTESAVYSVHHQSRPSSEHCNALCNKLQHTATLTFVVYSESGPIYCNALQHTATHYNSLQHTAAHCNTLKHIAAHYNTLQHIATHCNILQHTATHCNTLHHTTTHCNALQHTTTHCNTLHRTATHCNTLQITATHCNVNMCVLPRKWPQKTVSS